MTDLDPRVAAVLALHKPRELGLPDFGRRRDWPSFYECLECDGGPWPCDTAKALGVPGEPNSATSLLEARTWWWQAHGLDEKAAAVAAALEKGA